LGVKRSGREADHPPQSGAEVKEWVELYLHSPIRNMAWCSVKEKAEEQLCFNERLRNFYSTSHITRVIKLDEARSM